MILRIIKSFVSCLFEYPHKVKASKHKLLICWKSQPVEGKQQDLLSQYVCKEKRTVDVNDSLQPRYILVVNFGLAIVSYLKRSPRTVYLIFGPDNFENVFCGKAREMRVFGKIEVLFCRINFLKPRIFHNFFSPHRRKDSFSSILMSKLK